MNIQKLIAASQKTESLSYRVRIRLAGQRVTFNWKSFICVLIALETFLFASSLEAKTKSIAIIGAGPSGLVAAKSALEMNFVPTVFEKSEAIGGIWHPKLGATWNSLSTNLSRFSCMFSDFPWSSEVCMFPNQLQMFQYLEQYAKQFRIFPYIRTSTEVLQLNYISWRNQWQITWRDSKKSQTDFFDFVAVCSGFFSQPFYPELRSYAFFGEMIHAKDYKNSCSFRDKIVVVVGNAFSGVEIAADLAGSAKEVIHISSRPVWVLNRYLNGNTPLDLFFYQRLSLNHSDLEEKEKHQAMHRKLSSFSKQQFISPFLNPLKEYGTQPPLLAISDTYLDLVKESKIKLQRGRVVSLEGRHIFLENGEHVVADVVIFCTGYRNSLPFFDQKQRMTLQFEPSDPFLPLPLHKITFHPSLPNLVFVGMYRGPYFGIMELQARWAMLAFANPERYYPSEEVMHAGIKDALKVRCLNPRPQFPYGDYIGLADSLAKEIGVDPDPDKLSARDREVIMHSPVIPSIYRFVGPFAHPDLAFDIVSECVEFVKKIKNRGQSEKNI